MEQYTFLWRGKNAQGTSGTERVTAADARAAREQLTAAGWTELELITDEIASLSGQNVQAADWMKEEPLTPEQEVAFFEGKGPGFLVQWMNGIAESWLTLLIFGGLIAFGVLTHRTWPIVIGAIPIAFIVLLGPAVHLFLSLPLREYNRLNKAKVWGRWEEVLKCVERLRSRHKLTRLGVGEVELTRCRAQALAGLGRLDEGVREFQQLEHSPDLQHWLYLSHLSTIYDAAKAWHESQECRRRAAEEKPDTSATWTDVAYGNVRGFNRPAEAREALKRAEELEITGLGKAYLPFVRGMILWREGQHAAAKPELNQALQGLAPFATNPLTEGLLLLIKSYLCAAHRALGERSEADKLFAQVEKFLIANRETELLEACRHGTALVR